MIQRYVALLRLYFNATDDVTALAIASAAAGMTTASAFGSSPKCEVIDVATSGSHLPPEAQRMALRRARNILIGLRTVASHDLARQLDQTIYTLQFRDDPEFSLAGYSHGDFQDLTERILRGEEPEA